MKTTIAHQCPLCGRSTRLWSDISIPISSENGKAVVIRPCRKCATKPGRQGRERPGWQESPAVAIVRVEGDGIDLEAYAANINPFVHNAHREADRVWMNADNHFGVRVRRWHRGEALVVAPEEDRDRYSDPALLALVDIEVLPLEGNRLRAVLPDGEVKSRLLALSQAERDTLLRSDRDAARDVVNAVWPDWMSKEKSVVMRSAGVGAPKAAHSRRGHWRRTPSGLLVWVNPCEIHKASA